jgi:ribosomal protein L13
VAGQKLPKTDLQQELEKESLKIASVPKGTAKVSLRTEPKKLLERDIRKMLARHDFYDDNLNWRGSFANDFVDNGDGTITDRATGLMWQKSGSSRAKEWKQVRTYVKQLNKGFAGYSDWRLPTIDELASLVERETVNGVHIDPIFYNKQNICWSADKGPVYGGSTANPPQIWHINFREGSLGLTVLPIYHTAYTTRRYVRAVRSSNEEKKKSRLEQQKRHEEELKLASIPEGTAKVSLRTEPKKLLERDIRKMLARYGFYDDDLNWRGSFANDFVDSGNGTITDNATGLMWERGGSPTIRSFKRSKFYVRKLNEDKFAGYSDWRLPTVEELASLLRKDENNGVHTDPLFDTKQKTCWSSDDGPPYGGSFSNPQVWHISFREGSLGLTILPIDFSAHLTHRYVRAVRSLR